MNSGIWILVVSLSSWSGFTRHYQEVEYKSYDKCMEQLAEVKEQARYDEWDRVVILCKQDFTEDGKN